MIASRRRALAVTFGLAVAVPVFAQATLPRVVVLTDATTARLSKLFPAALAKQGYVDGRNVRIEYHSAMGDPAALERIAAAIARTNPDVIFSPSTRPAVVMRAASKTIPIVAGSADPVAAGLVASLPRPGGNVTGLLYPLVELAAKRMQMLKELVPSMTRATALWNPHALLTDKQLDAAIEAARALGVTVDPVEIRNDAERERAFAAMSRNRPQAIIIIQDPYLLNASEALARFAVAERIPASHPYRRFVDAGGLFSYGVSGDGGFDRAASYIDKILKGAKPADLPVTQADEFEFVVNDRALDSLGITLPKGLALRVTDRVR